MEKFQSILIKMNQYLKDAETQSLDLSETAQEIHNFYYLLESVYHQEFNLFLNELKLPELYKQLEINVYDTLIQKKYVYSLVSDLNKIYISENDKVVKVFPIISNPLVLFGLSNHEFAYVLKYYLCLNHRLEICSLGQGLGLTVDKS